MRGCCPQPSNGRHQAPGRRIAETTIPPGRVPKSKAHSGILLVQKEILRDKILETKNAPARRQKYQNIKRMTALQSLVARPSFLFIAKQYRKLSFRAGSLLQSKISPAKSWVLFSGKKISPAASGVSFRSHLWNGTFPCDNGFPIPEYLFNSVYPSFYRPLI